MVAGLGLNAGYLSRLLARLEDRGVLRRKVSADDSRRAGIMLTAAGKRLFAALNQRTNDRIAAMLEPLGHSAP